MNKTTIDEARKYLCGTDYYITSICGDEVYCLNNRLAKALCDRYDKASKTEQKKILRVLEAMNCEHISCTEYKKSRVESVYAYEPTGYKNPNYIYDYLDKFIPKYLGMEYILRDIPF